MAKHQFRIGIPKKTLKAIGKAKSTKGRRTTRKR